jgi:hypothetical protein
MQVNHKTSQCPLHGAPVKRSSCTGCNAAYMRNYLRMRREMDPVKELCARARKRADKFCLPYSLDPSKLIIPEHCPALGIPLLIGGKRSLNSPSLDRIEPSQGYVQENVRVISDHANRLKSNRTSSELWTMAIEGREDLREAYRKLHTYVEREALLAAARNQLANPRRSKADWAMIVDFLDTVSTSGRLDVWTTVTGGPSVRRRVKRGGRLQSR